MNQQMHKLYKIIKDAWYKCSSNSRNSNSSSPLSVDGWIILGWISRRWDVGMWTGLGWLWIETGSGRL